MDDIKFTSLQELYNRLKPALATRVKEIKRLEVFYVKEEDIWNYLKTYKWNKENNLTLIDMVNDILEVDPYVIEEYVKKSFKNIKRDLIVDENNLL